MKAYKTKAYKTSIKSGIPKKTQILILYKLSKLRDVLVNWQNEIPEDLPISLTKLQQFCQLLV